jgi:hypothetical protein
MKALRWFLIGTLLAVAFAGCYTRLVHPPVTDESGTYYHPRKNCSDCHSSADYYYYHFPYGSYYGWGGRYWSSYYWDPWWYHDYWNWEGDGSEPAGTTRYWDNRGRSGDVPMLVPPASGTKTKDSQAPPAANGSQVGESKDKNQNDSGSRYYERDRQGREPEKKPPEPKKEPNQTEQKKDTKEKN